jgi:hypothetical protein
MKISIKIEVLEEIVRQAKIKSENNSDLSETVDIELIKAAEWHNGTDDIKVSIQSVYAECDNKFLCQNY